MQCTHRAALMGMGWDDDVLQYPWMRDATQHQLVGYLCSNKRMHIQPLLNE